VAVSEVDGHDAWQRAEIGVSAVGNSGPVINSLLDKVLDFVERLRLVDAFVAVLENGLAPRRGGGG